MDTFYRPYHEAIDRTVEGRGISLLLSIHSFTPSLAGLNREFYAGVSLANLGMKPSAYVYYSTELKQTTFEVAGSKTFAGSNVGLTGCDLVFRAYAGICDASTSVHATRNSYGYTGASLDVTRQIGRGPEVGAGVNWAHNRDGQTLTNGSVFWGRVYAKFIF